MNAPRVANYAYSGATQIISNALPVDANFNIGGAVLGAGNVLLGLLIFYDSSYNTGTHLLDLGPCFDATQNYSFNLNVNGCLLTWKTAQYNQYGLRYYNYTPPVAVIACNTKCQNVGRNLSTSLVKYDITQPNGVANGFFQSVASLQISSNVTGGNIDQIANGGLAFQFNSFVLLLILITLSV